MVPCRQGLNQEPKLNQESLDSHRLPLTIEDEYGYKWWGTLAVSASLSESVRYPN